jgi:hypothetical protein
MSRIQTLSVLALLLAATSAASDDSLWVEYAGHKVPGQGKRIVLVAGDEEYRSEEALPMLGKILAVHHGFHCTVLFSIDPASGEIDPNNQTNLPGIEMLATADMMIVATRFRELPDEQMKYVDDFVNSGKPILGLRTATHAFHYTRNKNSRYARYDFQSSEWPGGFGQQVLGETWISHHGHHKVESCRGVINEDHKNHPILRGVTDVWGPSDVYGIRHLTDDANVLLFGQVLKGMNPGDEPVEGAKNNPMMPLMWTKTYTGATGKTARIACTTMGAAVDFESEGLRRAIVNAVYWCLGMENKIPPKNNVAIVGEYHPTMYGFGSYRKGVRPADHKLN